MEEVDIVDITEEADIMEVVIIQAVNNHAVIRMLVVQNLPLKRLKCVVGFNMKITRHIYHLCLY